MKCVFCRIVFAVAALPPHPLLRISRAVLSEDMNTCFDYTTGGRAAPPLFVIKLNSKVTFIFQGRARSLCGERHCLLLCERRCARGSINKARTQTRYVHHASVAVKQCCSLWDICLCGVCDICILERVARAR